MCGGKKVDFRRAFGTTSAATNNVTSDIPSVWFRDTLARKHSWIVGGALRHSASLCTPTRNVMCLSQTRHQGTRGPACSNGGASSLQTQRQHKQETLRRAGRLGRRRAFLCHNIDRNVKKKKKKFMFQKNLLLQSAQLWILESLPWVPHS